MTKMTIVTSQYDVFIPAKFAYSYNLVALRFFLFLLTKVLVFPHLFSIAISASFAPFITTNKI